ncbi:MAG: site-specific DNA-methyltransferase, partial [Nanoarchaeota archaeon]|nr:site-specific DNA-methyltransferase [Nanoarchaeota archaeon]
MVTNSLVSELEFEKPNGNGSTTYLTHNFHTYPAKFIPQIPRGTILQLTKEGDTILDPFCGCGTTLAEAKLLNRNAIGVDLNPIAVLVSKAKTNKLEKGDIDLTKVLLQNIKSSIANYYDTKTQNGYKIPDFNNRDHWFQQNVLHELGIIKANIMKIPKQKLRDFLFTAMSSIIVIVSNQESDTRFAAIDKQIKPFRTF